MGFETVTDYLPVPPGEHLLELRPSGAAPTSAPVWSGKATLESGKFYTAAGLGPKSQLTAELFTDDITMPAGRNGERAVHQRRSRRRLTVSVAFGGSPLAFSDAEFAKPTPYEPVAPGKYDVSLKDGSGTALVGSQFIEFSPGVSYTVVAIGGEGTAFAPAPRGRRSCSRRRTCGCARHRRRWHGTKASLGQRPPPSHPGRSPGGGNRRERRGESSPARRHDVRLVRLLSAIAALLLAAVFLSGCGEEQARVGLTAARNHDEVDATDDG